VVEPANAVFRQSVIMTVPWFSLGETVEAPYVRAWTSPGIEGIPEGLWELTTVTSRLPDSVQFNVARGGTYWAGTWEENPARVPQSDSSVACTDAVDASGQSYSSLDVCADGSGCRASGCFAEYCGFQSDRSTVCRPASALVSRFGCRCRCVTALCQWVR